MCPTRSSSRATSIPFSPTARNSISTINRRPSSRPSSSAPRSRPTGPPYDLIAQTLPDNPHVHFFESRRRGYVIVDLEHAKMQVHMRVVSDAHDPKADISTLKTYAVESGHPGVVEVERIPPV
jgi:phosphodiesterase/alkaline phosphatase D-like protein